MTDSSSKMKSGHNQLRLPEWLSALSLEITRNRGAKGYYTPPQQAWGASIKEIFDMKPQRI